MAPSSGTWVLRLGPHRGSKRPPVVRWGRWGWGGGADGPASPRMPQWGSSVNPPDPAVIQGIVPVEGPQRKDT